MAKPPSKKRRKTEKTAELAKRASKIAGNFRFVKNILQKIDFSLFFAESVVEYKQFRNQNGA